MKIAKDKQLHLGAGFLIALALVFIGPFVALTAVVLSAAGKELYDHFYHGTVDINDFVATVLGALPVILGSLFYV